MTVGDIVVVNSDFKKGGFWNLLESTCRLCNQANNRSRWLMR